MPPVRDSFETLQFLLILRAFHREQRAIKSKDQRTRAGVVHPFGILLPTLQAKLSMVPAATSPRILIIAGEKTSRFSSGTDGLEPWSRLQWIRAERARRSRGMRQDSVAQHDHSLEYEDEAGNVHSSPTSKYGRASLHLGELERPKQRAEASQRREPFGVNLRG